MRLEDLPRNPAEGARMPEPAPQANRVVVIEGRKEIAPGTLANATPPNRSTPPLDDDQMGARYSR